MTRPTTSALFQVLDATWPPAKFIELPNWTLRQGAGGGQRVSAATAKSGTRETHITDAETGMHDLDQHALFMLRPGEGALDQWLEARNYDLVDPVTIYLVPTIAKGAPPPRTIANATWPPSSEARALWQSGGIGPARIAVMDRVDGKKSILSVHDGPTCTGVAFVAISDDIAMLHALEVSAHARRRGIGTDLMDAATNWAAANGAAWLALMVTRANTPANALYHALGMREVGHYHYRRAPQATP